MTGNGTNGREGMQTPADGDEAWKTDVSEAAEQLTLDGAEDDDRLPWLESPDDYEDSGAVDTARIVWFALIGIVLLGVIIGLIWWMGHRGPDPEMVAGGATIEAPKEPYKTRPDDPGGKEFAGTGDTSFKVGEGQESEGRLAETAAPVPAPAAGSGQDGPSQAAQKTGVAVQIGAYSTRESARTGWNTLYARHDVLKGHEYRIVEGRADIGKVYRLQAMAADGASANQLCASLKAQGAACQVKR